MKIEKEITVFVTSSFDELHNKLIDNGFEIKDRYVTNDIYMINKDVDINKLTTLEILKQCVIVREITGIKKELVYKKKEYDEEGNITFSGKIECLVKDLDKALEFMRAINYQELIQISDQCTEYGNDDIELIVQQVNNKYLLFEVEDKCRYINKTFSSIDEMKNTINKYDLPFKKDNYFVKKAELILNEKLNRK